MLLPLAHACLVVGTLSPLWSIPLLLFCLGLSNGLINPVVGALWVELYGSAHIGAIRSLVAALLMAASAPGPGLAGALIDAGIELDGQAGQAVSISGLCAVVAGLIVTSLMGRLDRRLVLIGMALLLAVAGTLVSLAPNFLVLMIGCALLGIPIGGFWSLNTPVLMRLLPVALVPLGLATGQGGTALAGAVAAPWAAPWAT